MEGDTLGKKIKAIKLQIEEDKNKENLIDLIQKIKSEIENGIYLWIHSDIKHVIVYPSNFVKENYNSFNSADITLLSSVDEPLLSACKHLIEKEEVDLSYIEYNGIVMVVLAL